VKKVEGTYSNTLRTLLGTPGIFGVSEQEVINVQAELLYWKIDWTINVFEVFYEFRSADGTLLLAKKVTSRAKRGSTGNLRVLAFNVSHEVISNNLAQLGRLIKKKLPDAWAVYAKKRDTEIRLRRQIAAGLKRENRYFQVITSKAMLRELPDAGARVVTKLTRTERVHATGSLPSGWLEVSKEGRAIGWIHYTALREDFTSVSPYPTPSATPLPSSVLPEITITGTASDIDAASLHLGTYHALVIGNNNYRYIQKLKTAVNDARSMAQVLQEIYGFNVKLLTEATRSQILDSLNAYRRNLSTNDNLLIFYAGHGWLDKEAEEGYWLPIDAQEHSTTNWVSNSAITAVLRAMSAKHVIIVSDSCYSGTLARGIKPSMRKKNYYQKIARKKSRTVMASGGLEPVADSGGKSNHSVFASALIEALKENKGIMDATLLFSAIRRQVAVNSDQTPEYSDIRKAGHDGGDFLFARQKR
jgi:uncharacterized caspase-like protein